ncbi:MAG: ABC transporter permease, partial [Chloroflexi bacterium]|nr:ABC transporter permease [Chloroflexota bacterium]
MASYIAQRLILAAFTIVAISILSFLIIHLPPGDYVTSYIAQMAASGGAVSAETAQNLRIQYGLDQPIYIQYLRWVGM